VFGVAALAVAAFLPGSTWSVRAQQAADPAIRIGDSDLGGVVTGPNGPEAGVWVIAETIDLPTKFAKIVVTDERGRYVLPDLPKANYSVWVRGYGLVDSAKVQAAPGKQLDLRAVPAPDEKSAAQYYPAIYWWAMLKVPDKGDFPGTGPNGNGIPTGLRSQSQWLAGIKTDGCVTCHQLGNLATRTIPQALSDVDSFSAWTRRIQSGQASEIMARNISRLDTQRALKLFADWTDRIAAGELPAAKPQRPQGVERNVVVSVWDWSSPTAYLHDEVSTDKRNPTVNANGPIFGSTEWSTDRVPILDPVKNAAHEVKIPVRDPKTPSSITDPMFGPSPYWGREPIWDSQTTPHNPMVDHKGRAWFTARIRPPEANPDFCKKGSDHPSAKLFPIERSGRQLAMYDPKTDKFTLVNTCFSTHHLIFAEDANNTLWLSVGVGGNGVGDIVGWLNTKMLEETGDEAKSQGWTPMILDTNGNGRRDDGYVGPRDPVDPTKDKRILAPLYGIAWSPVDGSIWGSVLGFPGGVVRLNLGDNPPQTTLAEFFEVPFNEPRAPISGYSPRGLDIDRNGVAWVPLASGHMASFDRKKCKGPLNGPQATGRHCPEGWTLYPFPGPQFQGVSESGSAEASYFTWVDQHDVFGLGKNVPMATGNNSDSVHVLVDGKFVELRVPYPMGFFVKGLDGRIDDPQAGWKGRGLWTAYGNRTPFHIEGGKGTRPKVVKFQLRPDPLAR
jgi:hypothetical protein